MKRITLALPMLMLAPATSASPYSELVLGYGDFADATNVELVSSGNYFDFYGTSGDMRHILVLANGYEVDGLPESDLSNMYLIDRQTKTWEHLDLVEATNDTNYCIQPRISADGRQVIFACNVDSGIFQLYVKDRALNTIRDFGQPMSMRSDSLRLSGDGKTVVFTAQADVSALGDANGVSDVVRIRVADGSTTLVSVSSSGTAGNDQSFSPDVSFDGNRIIFQTIATNLVPQSEEYVESDTPILMHEVSSSTTTRVSDPEDVQLKPAAISGNGNIVSYFNSSGDLVRRDLSTNQLDVIFASQTDLVPGDTVNAYGQALDFTGCNLAFYVVYFDGQTNDSTSPDDGLQYNCDTREIRDFGVVVDGEIEELFSIYEGFFGGELIDKNRRVFISDDGRMVAFRATKYTDPYSYNFSEYGIHVYDEGKACDADDPALRRAVSANTWVMLSLPCLPLPGSNTVAEIFSDDVPGVYGTDWKVFRFDSETGLYTDTTLDTTLSPGDGFWFQYRSETVPMIEIDLPSDSNETISLATDTVCGLGEACQRFDLPSQPDPVSQWTLLGVGRNEPVRRDQLRVSTATGICSDTDGCAISEADGTENASPTLFEYMYIWDPSSEPKAYRQVGNDADVIMPWDAVWVAQYPSTELNPVILHVPADSE